MNNTVKNMDLTEIESRLDELHVEITAIEKRIKQEAIAEQLPKISSGAKIAGRTFNKIKDEMSRKGINKAVEEIQSDPDLKKIVKKYLGPLDQRRFKNAQENMEKYATRIDEIGRGLNEKVDKQFQEATGVLLEEQKRLRALRQAKFLAQDPKEFLTRNLTHFVQRLSSKGMTEQKFNEELEKISAYFQLIVDSDITPRYLSGLQQYIDTLTRNKEDAERFIKEDFDVEKSTIERDIYAKMIQALSAPLQRAQDLEKRDELSFVEVSSTASALTDSASDLGPLPTPIDEDMGPLPPTPKDDAPKRPLTQQFQKATAPQTDRTAESTIGQRGSRQAPVISTSGVSIGQQRQTEARKQLERTTRGKFENDDGKVVFKEERKKPPGKH